jgi:preprotein translocase subunit SecG
MLKLLRKSSTTNGQVMTVIFYIALFLFLVLCGILCLVILIQESKSLGLGASFGGDPGDSVFGTSTADVLKKFTAWLAIIFMAACVLLSLWTGAMGRSKARLMPTSIEQMQE